jgi:hypothetical protein
MEYYHEVRKQKGHGRKKWHERNEEVKAFMPSTLSPISIYSIDALCYVHYQLLLLHFTVSLLTLSMTVGAHQELSSVQKISGELAR